MQEDMEFILKDNEEKNREIASLNLDLTHQKLNNENVFKVISAANEDTQKYELQIQEKENAI